MGEDNKPGPSSTGDDLVTIAEAAARTRYSVQHIWRLVTRGVVVGRRSGGIWLVSLASIEAYRRTNPKPGPRPSEPDT